MATRQRPQSLARLLRGLSALRFVKSDEPSIVVIVVDNDDNGSARPVVDELMAVLRWPVDYQLESRPGISAARNRAIEAAGAAPDFIAFIDDDEVPAPEWLDELLAAQRLYAADIVAGPVCPRFEAQVAPWLEQGGFYRRERRSSGSVLEHVATNNVLLRSDIINAAGLRFNETLVHAGGEDVLFFLEARKLGYVAVWADDAVVDEWIPATRTNTRWLLQRAFSGGNSFRRCQLLLEPSIRMRLTLMTRSATRVLLSLLAIPAAVPVGRSAVLNAMMGMMRGAGGCAAALGVRYEEYRRVHGK